MSKYKEKFEELKLEQNEKNRKIQLLLLMDDYFQERKTKTPTVVGGEAVEIYTGGAFTSYDIDLKGDKEVLIDFLEGDLGFTRVNHRFVFADPEFAVEWLGTTLEEGAEAEKKIQIIKIGERRLHVVSPEDLIIDRLNAAKHWQHEESYLQAREIYLVCQQANLKLDEEYLEKRALLEDVADTLDRIRKERLTDLFSPE